MLQKDSQADQKHAVSGHYMAFVSNSKSSDEAKRCLEVLHEVLPFVARVTEQPRQRLQEGLAAPVSLVDAKEMLQGLKGAQTFAPGIGAAVVAIGVLWRLEGMVAEAGPTARVEGRDHLIARQTKVFS